MTFDEYREMEQDMNCVYNELKLLLQLQPDNPREHELRYCIYMLSKHFYLGEEEQQYIDANNAHF